MLALCFAVLGPCWAMLGLCCAHVGPIKVLPSRNGAAQESQSEATEAASAEEKLRSERAEVRRQRDSTHRKVGSEIFHRITIESLTTIHH